MRHRHLTPLALLLPVLIGAGCTMKSQDAPPLAGPSEFGTSITVSPSPDILPQDGRSQAVIGITARDGAAQPVRNLSLRVETAVNGVAMDFGSLSARNVVTGADGRATVVYTAPPAPVSPVGDIVVEIWVFPIGTDYNNTAARTGAIRLVPPGVVLPPDGLVAAFEIVADSRATGQTILFDASNSQSPNSPIVSYTWDFGDGVTATGKTVVHAYLVAGAFPVKLTVTDAFNRQASTSQLITIQAGEAPTPEFAVSPTNPRVNDLVTFNASQSKAAAGRTIVEYTWDFGDGSPLVTGGATVSHRYSLPRTYSVTLKVKDNLGAESAITKQVQVAPPS